MRRLTNIGAIGAILLSTGCAGILPAIQAASQLGQMLGSVLDTAEQGGDIYYDRHPNTDARNKVEHALMRAREALATYDRLVGDPATTAEQIRGARARAVEAYGTLRALLEGAGVLDAEAPSGGAESDTMRPEPFDLPTVETIGAM